MCVFAAMCMSALVFTLAECAGAPEHNRVKPALTEVGVLSAGPGSAFLPYAQGAAAFLTARGLRATALESRGSIENMQKVQVDPKVIGMVFLGTAHEGVNAGSPCTQATVV